METVLRSAIIYLILLVVFRISGKRSLAQITTFDFILLLIISEAVQQAMIIDDYSITNAVLVILTLVGMDILISLLKGQSKSFTKLVDSVPVMLIENGEVKKDRMDAARVDESDILSEARKLQGIERIDQIKYAVLERSGGITVIPKQG